MFPADKRHPEVQYQRGIIVLLKTLSKITGIIFVEHGRYNNIMAKPVKTLELYYPMIMGSFSNRCLILHTKKRLCSGNSYFRK